MNDTIELLDRVEIVEDEASSCLMVKPIWKGVDRPYIGGWELPIDALALAERLRRAIEDGAVHKDARIGTDADGRTYVTSNEVRVFGRTMNADLKRLGY